uniref:Uncharacterized protein n=1 Tax=Trepomonas sp. PC1 TaxID=1076344 RepID=A0A146K2D7_9EUKA|eukprot:JAP90075.1 Hypothetical protein TPC1_30430 [Trepomonas sp. PC1]
MQNQKVEVEIKLIFLINNLQHTQVYRKFFQINSFSDSDFLNVQLGDFVQFTSLQLQPELTFNSKVEQKWYSILNCYSLFKFCEVDKFCELDVEFADETEQTAILKKDFVEIAEIHRCKEKFALAHQFYCCIHGDALYFAPHVTRGAETKFDAKIDKNQLTISGEESKIYLNQCLVKETYLQKIEISDIIRDYIQLVNKPGLTEVEILKKLNKLVLKIEQDGEFREFALEIDDFSDQPYYQLLRQASLYEEFDHVLQIDYNALIREFTQTGPASMLMKLNPDLATKMLRQQSIIVFKAQKTAFSSLTGADYVQFEEQSLQIDSIIKFGFKKPELIQFSTKFGFLVQTEEKIQVKNVLHSSLARFLKLDEENLQIFQQTNQLKIEKQFLNAEIYIYYYNTVHDFQVLKSDLKVQPGIDEIAVKFNQNEISLNKQADFYLKNDFIAQTSTTKFQNGLKCIVTAQNSQIHLLLPDSENTQDHKPVSTIKLKKNVFKVENPLYKEFTLLLKQKPIFCQLCKIASSKIENVRKLQPTQKINFRCLENEIWVVKAIYSTKTIFVVQNDEIEVDYVKNVVNGDVVFGGKVKIHGEYYEV